MPIAIHEQAAGRILELVVSGKLSQEDYGRFVPEAERQIERHGQVRLLVRLDDFDGWEAGALWTDLKFDLKHFNDVERLAIVGQTKFHKGMSLFSKPFTMAEVRYFDYDRLEEARAWVAS